MTTFPLFSSTGASAAIGPAPAVQRRVTNVQPINLPHVTELFSAGLTISTTAWNTLDGVFQTALTTAIYGKSGLQIRGSPRVTHTSSPTFTPESSGS